MDKAYCVSNNGADFLHRLGISNAAFEMAIARELEGYKTEYYVGRPSFCIVVNGNRTARHPSPLRKVIIDVEEEDLKLWFDEAYVNIKAVVDSIMSRKVKWVILAGGFFCNNHLRLRLHEAYHDAFGISIIDGGKHAVGDLELSVVRGWLARAFVRKTQVPAKFGWGIVRDVWWNPEMHPDVPKGSPLIQIGSYERKGYVGDRWKWMLRPSPTPQIFLPKPVSAASPVAMASASAAQPLRHSSPELHAGLQDFFNQVEQEIWDPLQAEEPQDGPVAEEEETSGVVGGPRKKTTAKRSRHHETPPSERENSGQLKRISRGTSGGSHID
ncbi:hypothetical protein LTR85_011081 [Meristemomyces frigidus]|nr:hypothetical protein LTR85_011081 [Meristemomyces frigidus]